MSSITPVVLWMTGLSGAGKSTVAYALEKKLQNENILCEVLDGDMLRTGINAGLGFSESDRKENIRRAAEIAKILCANNFIVICSLITPTDDLREIAKTILGDQFKLVYICSSLETCKKRDVKGLYNKALKGEIPNFTGISAPFDNPAEADLIIDTQNQSENQSVEALYTFLRNLS
jgi:adenylylsulfate kinase